MTTNEWPVGADGMTTSYSMDSIFETVLSIAACFCLTSLRLLCLPCLRPSSAAHILKQVQGIYHSRVDVFLKDLSFLRSSTRRWKRVHGIHLSRVVPPAWSNSPISLLTLPRALCSV